MGWLDIELGQVDTPAVLIDKSLVQSNIEKAIAYAGDVGRLRPHVKTHKMLEVAQMQVAAGLTKFKCATIAEAEMLGMAQADDVLIAYPLHGPKIERFHLLRKSFPKTRYSALIDNIESARLLHQSWEGNNPIRVFIDVNDGHNRTGILPENVEELFTECQKLSSVSIVGLHCYDGHIRMPELEKRVQEGINAYAPVKDLAKQLSTSDQPLTLVAGGSPSFSVHAKYHDVECSPGTFIFWDARYDSDYVEQPFEKAAVVATRVISKVDPHTYCLDLGHKSIASEMPFPRVVFLGDLSLTQIGHSEEHLVVRSDSPDALKPGDVLFAYPIHICPTIALHERVHVVEHEKVITEWKVIARDKKITI